jgi:SAM-dependent MidA family methyltransferase
VETTLFHGDRRAAPNGLPEPEGSARDHSAQLARLIREEIARAGGSIAFARYMELALYAPGLGYYSAGAAKLGPAGDFVTAPEISPLFARCLARFCREVLGHLGGGDLLELGAGTGRLAAGILAELARDGCLPDRYLVLEVGADLRERQRHWLSEQIPELSQRVHWLDRLPEKPLRGVILANEVADALPVHRIRIEPEKVLEYRVGWNGEGFDWQPHPAPPEIEQAVARLKLPSALPAGYVTEISLALAPWVKSLGRVLDAGAALVIDYGFPRHEYYHPQRSQGTLMCHYRHRTHGDPLVLVGLQDITAHVDFSALAEAGGEAGLTVAGFTTQADFLLGTGLAELAQDAGAKDLCAQMQVAREVKKLVMPSEMGELFKVLALTRGLHGSLTGFAHDRRNRFGSPHTAA